jgi:hypothetical protein
MEGDAPRQSHTTFGIVERSSDGGFILKAFKQKLFVDGLSYLLQEIYGLENKSSDVHPNQVSMGQSYNLELQYYNCKCRGRSIGSWAHCCMYDHIPSLAKNFRITS